MKGVIIGLDGRENRLFQMIQAFIGSMLNGSNVARHPLDGNGNGFYGIAHHDGMDI
jgi:hypothetical protein